MSYFKLSLILILSLLLSACQLSPAKTNSSLMINGHDFQIELARTDREKFQGLSGRASLCADCGLLFVFEPATHTSFVMRDMNFPLDIIGIKDNQIVDIDKNCQPEAGPNFTSYQDELAVDYVLEVNAGTADSLNLQIGDQVNFKL